MGSKAKQVRDMLKMSYFKPEFLRADVIAQNHMVWFIEVDGLPMDARSLPLDLQTVAFRRGYIPYIPAIGPEGANARMGAPYAWRDPPVSWHVTVPISSRIQVSHQANGHLLRSAPATRAIQAVRGAPMSSIESAPATRTAPSGPR